MLHAELCKIFSNPTRLEILDLLRTDKLSVTQLIRKTGLSQANISQHLSIMKSKGIVVSDRDGKNVYYTLADRRILSAFDTIRGVLIARLRKEGTLASKIESQT